MRMMFALVGLGAMAISSGAFADGACSGTPLTQAQVSQAVEGATLHDSAGTYHEQHTGGSITETKQGGDPVNDPPVSNYASYSIASDGTIDYSYKSGYDTGALTVYRVDSSTLQFCKGGSPFTLSLGANGPAA